MSTIFELCQVLMETRKSIIYLLVDRLIGLMLALPITMAITERALAAMKLVKTRLQNRMEDGFLVSSSLTLRKDIVWRFDVDHYK